ncbi:MAG: PQQ-binding-like beta-propeller repeat protein [Verrucomicrobiales bacterium]
MNFPLYTLLLAFGIAAEAQSSWPQFRGATGQGIGESANVPANWSEESNVAWQTAIHGRAWSSPVVLDNQIWLTTASEDGQNLYAVAVDAVTGKIIHNVRLFEVPNPQFAHKFNTYGSPTPVVEKGRVYITFGSPGTACLDTKTGKVLWERRDFVCNHFRGAGSSPLVYEDKLIMNFDGSDFQYIVALDKKTGKTLWRTDRSIDFKDLTPEGKPEADGDWRKAYSTPRVAEFPGMPKMIISLGSKALYGYDLETGKDLWRVEERKCHSGSATPIIGDGVIYACMGLPKGELFAIKPEKNGDSITANVLWKANRNVPSKPSPILHDGMLFMIDDSGIASCLESATGKEIWRERIGGNYSASPILAGGNLYFCSEEGKTTVVRASKDYQVVSQSEIGDGFMASPAVVDDSLILRSRTHLYRIGGARKVANTPLRQSEQ